MTNTQLLILAIVIIAIYLYWKYQPNKTPPHNPDDIIERKGKQKERSIDDFNKSSEVFWDATEFSDEKENE